MSGTVGVRKIDGSSVRLRLTYWHSWLGLPIGPAAADQTGTDDDRDGGRRGNRKRRKDGTAGGGAGGRNPIQKQVVAWSRRDVRGPPNDQEGAHPDDADG